MEFRKPASRHAFANAAKHAEGRIFFVVYLAGAECSFARAIAQSRAAKCSQTPRAADSSAVRSCSIQTDTGSSSFIRAIYNAVLVAKLAVLTGSAHTCKLAPRTAMCDVWECTEHSKSTLKHSHAELQVVPGVTFCTKHNGTLPQRNAFLSVANSSQMQTNCRTTPSGKQMCSTEATKTVRHSSQKITASPYIKRLCLELETLATPLPLPGTSVTLKLCESCENRNSSINHRENCYPEDFVRLIDFRHRLDSHSDFQLYLHLIGDNPP